MNLNKNPSLNKFFCLVLFVSFFPHTTFGIFNYGGSQISLIFPLFFLPFLLVNLGKLKLDNFLLIIIFLSFIPILLNFITTEKYYLTLIIRTLAAYFFFIFFLISFKTYYETNESGIKKTLSLANIIWIFWGFLQVLGVTDANFAFTNRSVGENIMLTRGVNSLATEPFYFGMILTLFNFFYLLESNFKISNLVRKEKILLTLNFFTIFFLVKAATTIGISLLMMLFFFFKNFNLLKKQNMVVLLSFIFIFIFIINFFEVDQTTNRGLKYLFAIGNLEELNNLFLNDWSFNSRVENIFSPLIASYLNYGFPGGFNGYIDNREEIGRVFYNLSNLEFVSKIDINNINEMKISSFIGDFIFQEGIFGFVIILLIIMKIIKNNPFLDSLIILFILFIITINAQMTYSLIPLLLFISMYNNKKINN